MAVVSWTDAARLVTGSGLRWTAPLVQRCDPYLVWDDVITGAQAPMPASSHSAVSSSAGDSDDPTPPDIGVLVELLSASDLSRFVTRMNADFTSADRLRFLPAGFEGLGDTRFVTGFVTLDGLRTLVGLVASGEVPRFTLQESRRRPARAMVSRFLSAAATAWGGMTSAGAPVQGGGTYLGIIDDGLPFSRARKAIGQVGQRAHFWDQGWQRPGRIGRGARPGGPTEDSQYWQRAWDVAPIPMSAPTLPPPPSKPPRGFFYGRQLRPLAQPGAMQRPGGGTLYMSSDYYTPAPRRTHGAAVLGLMAPWLASKSREDLFPDHISGLAMVQLPTATVDDTTGGSLAARALDAVRFVLWREEEDRPLGAPPRPVVVNLSYGVHAGPHDGTSMFERALLEILCQHANLHVVIPAGNAARIGCHARRELAPRDHAGDRATLTLRVPPDHRGDSFVEIWMPPDAEIELAVRPPGSTRAYAVRAGQARAMVRSGDPIRATPDTIVFGAVYPKEAPQGTAGRMVLLAIGSTWRVPHETSTLLRGLNQKYRGAVCAPPGIWTLEVRNRASRSVNVDAWVERSDAPPDRSTGGRQAYFPDSCDAAVRRHNATAEGTLNGLATAMHERLHVVGAMRLDGHLSEYSAAGPARSPATRESPDIVAPADLSRAVPGLRSMGFVDGAVERINGTSAACAVYARALALELATNPNGKASARKPPDGLPEITCTPDRQPHADGRLRGQLVRASFPHELGHVVSVPIPRPKRHGGP